MSVLRLFKSVSIIIGVSPEYSIITDRTGPSAIFSGFGKLPSSPWHFVAGALRQDRCEAWLLIIAKHYVATGYSGIVGREHQVTVRSGLQ